SATRQRWHGIQREFSLEPTSLTPEKPATRHLAKPDARFRRTHSASPPIQPGLQRALPPADMGDPGGHGDNRRRRGYGRRWHFSFWYCANFTAWMTGVSCDIGRPG